LLVVLTTLSHYRVRRDNHQQQCFHAAYNSKRRVLLHASHKFEVDSEVFVEY